MMLCFGFTLILLPQTSKAATSSDIKFTIEASELLDESLQSVVTELPKNAPVLVLEAQDDWLKVQYKTQIGYLKSHQLATLEPQYMLVLSLIHI